MNILLSVITPCYNSGKYLVEAIDSVIQCKQNDCEVIIVDDGSTDLYTLEVLNSLEHQGCKIVKQENFGPASARNAGVKNSNGEFLLFLDSDNKIRPEYIRKGIGVLRAKPSVGVVYAKANFFGIDLPKPRFTPMKFDFDSILIGNYIDMCSIVRKKVWEELHGFDENRTLIGYEDWEFWIRVGLSSWSFEYIDEILFDYRVRDNSLMAVIDTERKNKAVEYISHKHSSAIFKRYKYYYRLNARFQKNPLLYFLKLCYCNYILGKKYLP